MRLAFPWSRKGTDSQAVSSGPISVTQVGIHPDVGAKLGLTLCIEVLDCRLLPPQAPVALGELPMGLSLEPQPSKLTMEIDYRIVVKGMEVLEVREARAEVWVGPMVGDVTGNTP